jgi:hypothetical protein
MLVVKRKQRAEVVVLVTFSENIEYEIYDDQLLVTIIPEG